MTNYIEALIILAAWARVGVDTVERGKTVPCIDSLERELYTVVDIVPGLITALSNVVDDYITRRCNDEQITLDEAYADPWVVRMKDLIERVTK